MNSVEYGVWSLFILCIPQSMDLCELVVADQRPGPDTPTGEGSADRSESCCEEV